ncbi:MAG: NAD(P)/FAD-dependent oxidoreductase [Candidatus Riflebacteria bacterium]|nr:NAD(P)/FAD-dependent oxidoreductase [Candidatus Riflebacteria bacterium]
MSDVLIIGAGVIGTAIARSLMRYDLKVTIVERANDVACGTSKANSAIIHAGYGADADTLKGQFNAKGNPMFDILCRELEVPFDRVGSLVLALRSEDAQTLQGLKENGEKLGVPGLKILTREEVLNIEPNANPDNFGALFAPSAGIIEPWELAIACAENAVENGAELILNFNVTKITKNDTGFVVTDGKKSIESKLVINCAGVYADFIYGMVTKSPEFKIQPRRGQYFLLDKTAHGLVKHILFPCPSILGKGVLVVPTVNHNILLGPDSEDLDPSKKEAVETTFDRLNFVKREVAKLCRNIPFRDNITTFAGLRAEATGGDFIIRESPQVSGFFNVAGIQSPGLSSTPAIAEHVVNWISDRLKPGANKKFQPKRRLRIKFMELSVDEKQALIKIDPRYGRVICRCEMITEGEIVDAIHRKVGGITLNGIKRRVRPGAGRCQGGFCGPRVLEILQRELGCNPLNILQEGIGSQILLGKTKDYLS